MDGKFYDILIIGGGASGMAAAISAKRENSGLKVAIVEKNERLGKKLYATGNGRCNLGNTNYLGAGRVYDFFDSLGLALRKEDEGRLYPFNGSASSVVKVLCEELERLGVELILGCNVEKIVRSSEENAEDGPALDSFNDVKGAYRFTAHTDKGQIYAKCLILSTGGKAGSEFGCTGDGLKFARELGLKTRSFYPVLTPIECCGDFSEIKGVRAKAVATLSHLNETIACEYGEVQFTEYGLSGICIMNLSLYLKKEDNAGEYGFGNYFITLDFAPDADTISWLYQSDLLYFPEDALMYFKGERSSAAIKEKLTKDKRLFYSILPEKLARRFENFSVELDSAAMYELVRGGISFGVSRPKGWKKAQCSGGGVELSEIEALSSEARSLPGLFVTGELLDFSGPCGGYNLGNAWVTGLRAGKAAAERAGALD